MTVALVVFGLVLAIPVAPATARQPQSDARTQIVDSRQVEGIPAGARPVRSDVRAARNRAARRHRPERPDGRASSTSPATAGSGSTGPAVTAIPASVVTPASDVAPVSVFSSIAGGPSSENPSIAASGTTVMLSSLDSIAWLHPTDPYGAGAGGLAPYSLFAVPTDEYYFEPEVAWSTFKGRFVAVMPTIKDESTSCSAGYLNVAISTTADPAQPWLRYKLPIGVRFPDVTFIGVSDDKLVMTTNEWGLALDNGSCVGLHYQGARIRVVDLADLIDGGTATFQDLGVEAGYFNWLPISPAPAPGTSTGGTALDIIGEQFLPDPNHVAFARITGSAKANAATISGGVIDLTAGGIVDAMIGPPIIPALDPSAIYFDERPAAVAGRAGHAWLATNDRCTPAGDTVVRACARFVELDTTTLPPTLVQDGLYGTNGSDTFLPAVGVASDGKAFLRMTRALSASVTPLDQYVVQLAAGGAMEGGPAALLFHEGSGGFNSTPADWAFTTTFTFDPAQASSVFNIGPANVEGYQQGQRLAHFRGGLTDAPSGTATLNDGRPWSNSYGATIKATPSTTSPIVWMRVSATSTTETTTGGERLVQGVDLPAGPEETVDVSRVDLGGTTGEGSHSAWIQFRTGAGAWSAPFEKTFLVDQTPPVITKAPTSVFSLGYTVGTTATIRTSWLATDVPSGIGQYILNRILTGSWSATYTGATTSHAQALVLGKSYRYLVIAHDQAGNGDVDDNEYGPTIKPLAYQGTTSAISYYTTFSTSTSSSYFGGSTRYSSHAGAKATFTFTGRSAAIVSTKGKTRGKFEVWVDGVKKVTLDMYSATTKYRQVVWTMGWATSGAHKVMIRVLGTSGRPRVDVDAFLKF